MFLLTQSNIKPLVATKDLKVIKILRKGKNEDDDYTTPFQGFPVELGKTLVPSKEDEESQGVVCGYDGCRTQIGGGYIHAYMDLTNLIYYHHPKDDTLIAVEAFIPKGTEYYVDLYLREVCAKRLYITDSQISNVRDLIYGGENLLRPEEILGIVRPTIEDIPEDVISPGWLYMSDGDLIYPKDLREKGAVSGVVAYVDTNDNITVLGLSQYFCDWYEADNICEGYYPKEISSDRWKLPSKQILQEVFANSLMQINAILLMIGDTILLDNSSNYWASSEFGLCHAWFCDTDYAYLSASNNIWSNYSVRPSLEIVLGAPLFCDDSEN